MKKAESLDIYDSSLYSVTTNNSDGTKTIELYQMPIKYIEEDEVKFIDTAIENASLLEQVTNQFFYKCETTPVKTFYPKHLSDGVSIENGEYGVECYPNTTDNDSKKLFSKPILSEKNTVVYESVFGDTVDVSYTPLANGLKEEIILNKRPDSNIFEFKVELENLQPIYLTGDSIPLKDKDTGEQVAAISQIDMRYSDSTQIGHQKNNNIKVYVVADSGFGKSTATLKTYVSFAMEALKALGYTYTFVNSPEDSNICVRGIDRDAALSIDAVKGDTASGLTTNIGKPGTTSSYDGQSFSPDGWKSVYTLTKKTVYIIWDSSLGEVNTSLFNRTKWETVVTHEIGHALGHEGHNEGVSIMMSLNKNLFKLSRSTPQIMDFNHLNQVY